MEIKPIIDKLCMKIAEQYNTEPNRIAKKANKQ